jgi:predicted metalloprotease with PDZ domain
MVVLTGGFHVAYGFGIPRRVFRQRPWSYTVVVTHTPPELEESEPIRMEVDFPDLPLYVADWIGCVPFRSLREVRPRLGVTLEETATGVVVTGVEEHLPGAMAGVAVGDVIVAIDGAPVGEVFDLQYGLLQCRPGGTATVVVRRHGAERKLTVSFPPVP